MKIALVPLIGLALIVAASAASAQRPDRNVEPPIVRSFNWFSFVGGNEIRDACGRDGRNRVRLVYNAIYDEQVRTYDVFLQRDGTAGLDIGVLADQGDVSRVTISDAGDVLGPWRMRRGQRILNPAETSELIGLLQVSNAFGPPRDGLRLPDVDFWWTVASCRGGVWGFQAYHYPTDGFVNVKFAGKLFAFDTVPVPVNPPRKLEPAELRRNWNAPPNHWKANQWTLTVGKDGLRPR
ncbi:MAG: hypothetical protein U1E60_05710 [Reyranellaceae bacterium]